MPVRSRLVSSFLAAVLIAVLQPVLSAEPVRVYRIQDLGFIGGSNYLVGIAINANGDVAGYGLGADGLLRAFRWTAAGGLEDLGTIGWQSSQATGMNDNGDVVGQYWEQSGAEHAFIARRGEGVTDLNAMYSQIFEVNAVNNAGQLTGLTQSGHAFKTQPDGSLQEFGTYFSFGSGINEAGEIAGTTWHDDERTQLQSTFRYSDGTGFVDLGTLNGGGSGAMSINEAGVIVGWSGGWSPGIPTRAFRAQRELPMADLGALPAEGEGAFAYAINDRGAVVGQAYTRVGLSPFLYTDAHGMIDLRDRITTAEREVFSIDEATAINNAGQIVANYNSPTGAYGTVLLTPVWRDFGGPVAAPTAEPSALRPAEHQMVPVSIDPHVTDEYDPEPACRIVRVVNSQAPRVGPDRDVEITSALSVNLRASRRGPGETRTYTITVACTDSLGVTSRSQVAVVVPHGHGPHD